MLTFNKPIGAGKGSFMSYGDSDRSAKSLTEDGDPTLYSDYYLINASTSTQKSRNTRVQNGKISFMSDMPRCDDPAFEDRSGARGPGTYDFHCSNLAAWEKGVSGRKATRTTGTTAFTNKAPLLGYIRKIDTPDAGEYDPEKIAYRGCSYSKAGSCSFVGNTPRCASDIVARDAVTGAGPESYDLSGRSITAMIAAKKNPRSPPFGSSSKRL